MSRRYLPLLQSDGAEYIRHFCVLLSKEIGKEISRRELTYYFGIIDDQASLRFSLIPKLSKRDSEGDSRIGVCLIQGGEHGRFAMPDSTSG